MSSDKKTMEAEVEEENARAVEERMPDPRATEPLEYVGTEKELEALGEAKDANTLTRDITNASVISTDDGMDKGTSAGEKRPKKTWMERLNPLRHRKIPPIPKERTVSCEYGAGWWSRLTFQWITPIMTVGYLRPLELQDIWLVNPDRSSEILTSKLQASFNKRVKRGDTYPLLGAIHEVQRREFWVGGIFSLWSSIFQVISPFTVRFLIKFADEAYYATKYGRPAPHIAKGIGLVLGITAMQICQSTGTNQFIYRGMLVGGQSRAMLINIIFEKAMRISNRAKSGGRKSAEEASHNEMEAELTDALSSKSKKHGFIKNMLKKKLEARGGPRVTPNKGQGIAGDGTGWSNGKIVNLMSVDTYRVDQAAGMFHLTWTSPIAIVITLIVLLINLSYSALAGFGLLVIGIPLLTKAIQTLFKRRRKINKVTDQRVSLTQEILAAVRFVKFFGWESSFLERLSEIRKREIKAIQILLAIRNSITAVSMSMPVFASMLAFITYSLSNHVLDPAPVFSSLALFNSLRLPLNLLPLIIGQVIDAWASIGRIQEFLLSEEQIEDATWDENMEPAVEIDHASFTWERSATHDPDKPEAFKTKQQLKDTKEARKIAEKAEKNAKKDESSPPQTAISDASSETTETEPFKIQGLDFTVGRNELVAVIGSVGSGKSSLLAALAGDMRKTSGKVRLGGSRALCAQYAWIQNATVKENILFGKPFNTSLYNRVIDACALRPDLEMLPAADSTEIGEKGITVSGGQKQRLNIARAIYFDADIVLMDDPLSAVDAHVGRHIMDNAICGPLLKDKARVLCTHQLWVLNRCDRIIWMEDGGIKTIDTYDHLMQENAEFQKLMTRTAQEGLEDKKIDGDEIETEKKDVKKVKGSKRGGALMQQEERAVKSVSWGVYKAYIKASGTIYPGAINFAMIFLALVLSQGANIATSLWLSYWTSNKFGFSDGTYIGVYAALGFSQAFLMYAFSTILSIAGTNASRIMLQRAMTRVLRAPMSFFDTTPLGRITNRFSKDIDTMDNTLTDAMRMYFITMAMIISVFALIISFFHYFAIALGPLFILFVFAADYYRSSAREMKRHEAVLRSTVFARFGESITGVACIRAYGMKSHFTNLIRDAVDQMNSAYFLTFANQRWLSVRLDLIGNTLVFTTGVLVVTSRFNVSPSIAGLVLSYILSIVQMIQFTIRQLAEVENSMNATERLHYYGTELDEEAPLHLAPVRDSWPEAGAITFSNVEMRYRAGLPLVLKGLSVDIAGGERIGIVGRTGAGKSSIMSTLFRLTELSGGSITIDGVNIATIGLHDLRSRLAIIPQDPTLFRGTIRSNLDPFNEHSDLTLWSALRQADLVESSYDPANPSHHTRIHLDSNVDEEGLNFSLGQRQLMALARALVRGSRIIVCDEATSSVDFETDEKIQRTMMTGFKGKTLLCIAHRLKTIVNYDRICVMDQGGIAELGRPIDLFESSGGIFKGMCERSGIRREDIFGAGDE